jgi:hypothetical protein
MDIILECKLDLRSVTISLVSLGCPRSPILGNMHLFVSLSTTVWMHLQQPIEFKIPFQVPSLFYGTLKGMHSSTYFPSWSSWEALVVRPDFLLGHFFKFSMLM